MSTQLHSSTALSNALDPVEQHPHRVPGSRACRAARWHQRHRTAALPRLRCYTQASSRRPRPQATRIRPGRPPLAHHNPSPAPTGNSLPGARGEVAPRDGPSAKPSGAESTCNPRPAALPCTPHPAGRGGGSLAPPQLPSTPTPGSPPCPLTQRLQRPREHHRRTGGHGATLPPRPGFRHTAPATLIGCGRYRSEAAPAAPF